MLTQGGDRRAGAWHAETMLGAENKWPLEEAEIEVTRVDIVNESCIDRRGQLTMCVTNLMRALIEGIIAGLGITKLGAIDMTIVYGFGCAKGVNHDE